MLVESVLFCLAALRAFFQTRADTALEILALRQRIAVLKRKRPRPQLKRRDRIFWIAFRRYRSRWTEVLIIVKPETVVGWHRAGFRLYGRWRSRSGGGRRKIAEQFHSARVPARRFVSPSIRIRRLANENLDQARAGI